MIIAKFSRPNSGYDYDKIIAKENLVVGNEYELEQAIILRSKTNIYLKGFGDVFNSVMFDFYRDGELVRITECRDDLVVHIY